MRIVSGKYGGRIIKPPGNFKARPTTDIAKEGLFNILQNHFDFESLEILDLFAGTGSIGIEFISRGAVHCDLIENNYSHFKFIKSVLLKLDIKNAKAIKGDVFKFLPKITGKYDIIFADPPYNHKKLIDLPSLIQSENILKKDGWLILEHPGNHNFSHDPAFFNLRKYGSVNFSFFKQINK